MGRRKRGTHPYDYTPGDDRRFAGSEVGGTLRVLHGPGLGMGVPEGVSCVVQVLAADGGLLDECHEGKFGKEHRLYGTEPGDRITVTVLGGFGDERLTAARTVRLTGNLADVVRFGVGPSWRLVEAIDTGDADPWPHSPTADSWGAGVRLRGAQPGDEPRFDALCRGSELEGRSMPEVARPAIRDDIGHPRKRELLDRVLDDELPYYAEA